MITRDRWQRVKEIFQSAQERTPTERLDFLNQVCGDDKTIREEVEALLTADESNDGDDFLSTPAYEFVAGMLSDESEKTSEFEAGQKVGRYTILCPLGAGGMGQIYLAQDEQLGRKIALKLIAREFATDERRVVRFEQEARAASALNHPNVCVIYETGVTENERHFIAMEYIQGITLREKLTREPIELREAIQIARQVADALAAAHAAGIVHRDIKPENIMLRPDGYVKVLDFGLAKLTEMILPEPPLGGQHVPNVSTSIRTEAGTLMGTVKYMSPEQLRETEKLDEQTDIWSLGVVLYEMLTRTTPFEGRMPNETIGLILGPQAPELSLSDNVPPRFCNLIKKALQKDRTLRYQTVTRLAADLKTLQRELQSEPEHGLMSPPVEPPIPWHGADSLQATQSISSDTTIFTRLKSQALHTADFLLTEMRARKTATVFAGITVILVLLFIPSFLRQILPPQQRESPIRMTSLTNSGTSGTLAISPDGKVVAHAEEQDGQQRLVLTSAVTYGTSELVPADEVEYLGLTFSPDNLYVYFTRKDRDGSHNLYRLPAQGGTPARVKDQVDSPISFSPQNNQFAFVRHDKENGEYRLIVSDAGGENESVIGMRKHGQTFSKYGLAWAPDSSVIVCAAGRWDHGYHLNLLAFDPKGGAPRLIGTQSWFSVYQIAWQADMSSLVISARERETTPHQLWRVSYPDGDIQKITTDLNEYLGVSLAGNKIVTVQQARSWRLWVADLADLKNARSITTGTGFGYGVTWTKNWNIVYSSMIHDHLNISRIAPDGSKVLLTEVGENYNPAASNDGSFVVFAAKRGGAFNIFRMNTVNGTDLQQLTFTDGNFYPSISPDNQWVAYDNLTDSRATVWKVPVQGGTPVKIAAGYRMPVFSPDGNWIAVRYDEIASQSADLVIYPANGGGPVRTVEIPRLEWQRVYWLDDHTLSFIKSTAGASNIWSLDLDTGVRKQLTSFNSEQIFSYAWSPDLQQVVIQRGGRISNVTIISSEQ